ncbi:MAG TPA: GAF domain-containing protein [Kofleriaceae bacterium]|nr:GAF domain-containing protein [Kofleriaceae bacterium]
MDSAAIAGSAPHAVRFYEDEDSIASIIADFIAEGLAAREGVLVVVTAAHRAQAATLLAQRGVAIDEALVAGSLLLLDADETLARILDGRAPSWERFHVVVNGALDAVAGRDAIRPIRAYGEMVDLMWRAGNSEGAIQLEEMWNSLQRERTFSLLCAYVMDNFYGERAGLRDVCATHTHAYGHGDAARVLLAEHRRNLRLQQVTAAIAAAVTREEVLEAVVDKVASALGASSLVLFLASDDRPTAELVRSVGLSAKQAAHFLSVQIEGAPVPAVESIRTGRPIWLDDQAAILARYPHLNDIVTRGRNYRVACLPLIAHEQVIGSMGLTFDNAPPLDIDEREFLQLIAGYSAMALERVRLQEEERTSRIRAELLYGLAGAVIVAQSVDDVYDAALDAITLGLRTTRSSILTYGTEPVMRFRSWRGLSDRYRTAVDGHSPWSHDTRNPQPIVIPDVENDPAMARYRPIFRDESIGALAFIPLITGQQLLGKFMVYYDKPRQLSSSEIDLARAIANHVAAAVARFNVVAELEESVRFNEMFTGILGHDLRNPLGAIVTAAQLAMLKNTSEKLTKPLSRILTSGARMARMIDQLLDFTHVRLGGGMPLSPQRLDLVPVVRHVVDELDDAHPEWSLSLDHNGDTAGAWDGDRLAQVFSNLIANALQHGDVAGGVRVRLDGSRRETLRAEVENVGTIPDDLLPLLFEPLAGGRSRRAGARGLGLGLFISREIVRAHGGTIDIRCVDGTRTIFVIDLPRAH